MYRAIRFPIVLFTLLFLLLAAKSTFAQTFDVTWTGLDGPGSAVFSTTYEGGGEYLINSISGTQDLIPIWLLGAAEFNGNDNLLYSPGTPGLLDNHGFSFMAGAYNYNIYYPVSPAVYVDCSSAVGSCSGGGYNLRTFTVTPTPEPRTFFLVLPAFVAFLFFAFRRGSA